MSGKQSLTVFVPGGYTDEYVNVDKEKGMEQYYTYNGGAIFYIANNVSWHSMNEYARKAQAQKQDGSDRQISKGIDASGFLWKEVQIDSLRFGYFNVPPHLQHKFDQALYSIKVKHGAL